DRVDQTPGKRRVIDIADYALIGDCHTNALVGCNGSIDWLCFPRPDSPSVFTHLLDDQHGGNFAVRVADASVTRNYVEDTNVLATDWELAEGEVAWLLATWTPAHLAPTDVPEPEPETWQELLDDTLAYWRGWVRQCDYDGDRPEDVYRAALVLKALTYAPTG